MEVKVTNVMDQNRLSQMYIDELILNAVTCVPTQAVVLTRCCSAGSAVHVMNTAAGSTESGRPVDTGR